MIEEREAQYGRLFSCVLLTLQMAVAVRVSDGCTKKQIADRIDCDPSSLSRVLNGHVPNLTLRTISDILWATDHEPVDFSAEAFEVISPNHVRPLEEERHAKHSGIYTIQAWTGAKATRTIGSSTTDKSLAVTGLTQ